MPIDTSKLNPTVKSAFEAWQGNDLQGWLSHFTADARLFDDGAPRDFEAFSQEIGKERFTGLDEVRADGAEIVGPFHSDAWGDFRTYFRFHLAEGSKFDRLDIGQAG